MTARPFPTITPTLTLPAIVAILGCQDGGPCTDGEPTAHCPHCGAGGRWVWTFLCEDGTRRGAMAGCLQLFPRKEGREGRLVQEAFKRAADAKEKRTKLASWWQDMVTAADALAASTAGPGRTSQDNLAAMIPFRVAVRMAEDRRQVWLKRNGYGYRRGTR